MQAVTASNKLQR